MGVVVEALWSSNNNISSWTTNHIKQTWSWFLIILNKACAVLPMIGSSFMGRDIVRRWNEKEQLHTDTGTYHQLRAVYLLGNICVADIGYSFWAYSLGLWVVACVLSLTPTLTSEKSNHQPDHTILRIASSSLFYNLCVGGWFPRKRGILSQLAMMLLVQYKETLGYYSWHLASFWTLY